MALKQKRYKKAQVELTHYIKDDYVCFDVVAKDIENNEIIYKNTRKFANDNVLTMDDMIHCTLGNTLGCGVNCKGYYYDNNEVILHTEDCNNN